MRAVVAIAFLGSAGALNVNTDHKSVSDSVDHAIDSMTNTVGDLTRDLSKAASMVARDSIQGAINDMKSINEMVDEGSKIQALQKYTFKRFVEDFKRTYEPRTEEWLKREELFNKNLRKITDHMTGPAQPWSQGINKFMDWTDSEMHKLMGYKSSKKKGPSALLQTSDKGSGVDSNPDITKIPIAHSWRSDDFMKVKGELRDQGACGSCWALAAVGALESHLRIKYGSSDRLSPQMLVSCMPNLQECGGTGGCQGATGELAFQYIKENGIPLDMNWPYTSFTGIDGKCNWMLQKLKHAQVGGYVTLPENKYKPLMNALYNEGPVVISVDASTWRNYETGVFAGCAKDATINHAVLAEGYGEELMEKTKKTHKYFLIKNSWGSDFGENGYIRLERIENEASYSGTDYHPEEGTACKGGPKTVLVAGMCGMYYDSVYPTGVKFVTPMEGGTKIMNMNAENPMNVLGSVFDKLKPQ